MSKTTLHCDIHFNTSMTEAGGCLVNLTDNKHYRIIQIDDSSTFTVEYVGFLKNTWYRFKEWWNEPFSEKIAIWMVFVYGALCILNIAKGSWYAVGWFVAYSITTCGVALHYENEKLKDLLK